MPPDGNKINTELPGGLCKFSPWGYSVGGYSAGLLLGLLHVRGGHIGLPSHEGEAPDPPRLSGRVMMPKSPQTWRLWLLPSEVGCFVVSTTCVQLPEYGRRITFFCFSVKTKLGEWTHSKRPAGIEGSSRCFRSLSDTIHFAKGKEARRILLPCR